MKIWRRLQVAWAGLGLLLAVSNTQAQVRPYPVIEDPPGNISPAQVQAAESFGHDVVALPYGRFAIGAPGYDMVQGPNDVGRVLLYDSVGTVVTTLVNAATIAQDGLFGWSLAGYGTQLAVGVPGHRDTSGGEKRGRVEVFSALTGQHAFSIPNPATSPSNDFFGGTLANLGSNALFVGAPNADAIGAGYIYGPTGQLITAVTPSTQLSSRRFGSAAARIDASHFAVGDPGDATIVENGGAVSIYDATGTWQFDIQNPKQASDKFGSCLAYFPPDAFLVGAPEAADDVWPGAGRVYMYSNQGDLLMIITNRTPFEFDRFGTEIAVIDSDFFAVGVQPQYGNPRVDIFHRDGTYMRRIEHPLWQNSPFGRAIAWASPDTLLIADPESSVLGVGAVGAVFRYIYERALPDTFEPDNTDTDAPLFPIGSTQTHNLHNPDDQDWVRFFAIPQVTYEITTDVTSTDLDTQIKLFRRNASGDLALIEAANQTTLSTRGQSLRGSGDETTRLGGTATYYGGETIIVSNLSFGPHYVAIDNGNTGGGQFEFSVTADRDPVQDITSGVGKDYLLGIRAKSGGDTALILVAVDLVSSNSTAPEGATLSLDGGAPQSFGGSNVIFLSTISTGEHMVAVTADPGYVPDEDPSLPGQTQNPTNELFGNPRLINVIDAEYAFGIFMHVPVVEAQATLRDDVTGAWLDNVSIGFEGADGLLSGLIYTQFPNSAVYGTPWVSDANGQFPTNVILPTADWHLTLSRTGYASITISNAIQNAQTGDKLDLGEYTLHAEDSDGDDLADWWESLYFPGTNAIPTNDTDNDGHDDEQEYWLGTDPTNANDILALDFGDAGVSTNGFVLAWGVSPGRVYSVLGTDDPSVTPWPTVAGPWTARADEVGMSWTNTASPAGMQFYRIGITMATP